MFHLFIILVMLIKGNLVQTSAHLYIIIFPYAQRRSRYICYSREDMLLFHCYFNEYK